MSSFRDFTSGVRYLISGFKFLFVHPRLWIWAVMPTLLNLLLLAVMLTVFFHYYGNIYSWLSGHLGHVSIENPSSWYWHALNALLWVFDILFQILIVLISLILLLVVSYGVSLIIASPFNDALSERVETIVARSTSPPFSISKFMKDLVRMIKIESIKATILLLIPVILFIFNLIPVIGGPIYIIATLILGAWSLGFSYADLPMGRRLLPLGERLEFARRHRYCLIGLGAGFAIPFFSLVFAAPMVVGGTLLYIDCTKDSL